MVAGARVVCLSTVRTPEASPASAYGRAGLRGRAPERAAGSCPAQRQPGDQDELDHQGGGEGAAEV